MSLRTYRKLAQHDRIANRRLHEACKALQPGDSRFRGDDPAALGWSEEELMR